MGGLTQKQQLILYSFGQCSQQLNRRFADQPLEVSVSKIAFIEALESSGLVSKKTRALYRNIETLEQKKLLSYHSRQLRFTQRGYESYRLFEQRIAPFSSHRSFWESHFALNRHLQAVFKGETAQLPAPQKKQSRAKRAAKDRQLTITKSAKRSHHETVQPGV